MRRGADERTRHLRLGGVLLGLGLGGFFDGIVFHQVLQWHHMLSSTPEAPVTTVAGLRVNTLADGLFHAATYVLTVAGLFVLWRGVAGGRGPWSTRGLVGLLLAGWGVFNLVEGVVDHLLLGIHHVNETVPSGQRVWWDLAFLVWGAVMLGVGWALWQQGHEEMQLQRPLGPRTGLRARG